MSAIAQLKIVSMVKDDGVWVVTFNDGVVQQYTQSELERVKVHLLIEFIESQQVLK